jgi:hypothetical protein
MNSIRLRPLIFIILIAIFLMPLSVFAQEGQLLTDFWKIGDKYTYDISTYGTKVGQSTGVFLGPVKHSVVGNKFLFQTETVVGFLNGNVASRVKSDLFTQSRGYPSFYDVTYEEKGDSTQMMGYLDKDGFNFKEKEDTTESEFVINISPSTVLCDRQSIPQWNIAFFNETDLDRDTVVFHVMIPYLKKRAMMLMTRQPDSTLVVMGKKTACRVFFSLRTDEYYYITPDHHVARVTLPKQGLKYELVAIDHVEREKAVKQDK